MLQNNPGVGGTADKNRFLHFSANSGHLKYEPIPGEMMNLIELNSLVPEVKI